MSHEHKGGANQGRRRGASLIVCTVVAVAASLSGIVPGLSIPKAYGATFPSGLHTGFVINGNKTAATLPDNINWNNIFQPALSLGSQVTPRFVPSPAYTTADGLRSSGIFDGTFFYDDGDPNNCSGASKDPTANQTSQTINSNPWVPAPANVQDKANLCTAAYAMEALSDSTGVRHFILYGYFTRKAGNGSVSIDTVFHSPTAGRCGNLMLDMQYPEGTAQFLDWRPASGNCTNVNGPGEWVSSGRTVDFTMATGQRTEGYPVASQQQNTFMEFGIDLTSAGLFGDSQCSTFSLAQTLSRTGSASALSSASVSDFLVNRTPLDISNCGTLSVTKKTPAGHTNDTFGFTVTNESSQGVVIPPSQTSIVGTLRSGQTQTFPNVLSSSLLHLNETTIPTPWQKQLAVCSFTDAAGVTHPTDVTDPDTPFTLIGGSRTDCVITNNAALVTVKKVTYPSFSDQEFDFGVGEHTARLRNDQSATFAVPSGTPITMTETVPDGWQPPSVKCGAVESQARSVTVTPVLGENITCTFTNTQNAMVTIEKRVPAADAGHTFHFTTDLGTPSSFTLEPATETSGGNVADDRTFHVSPGEFSVAQGQESDGFVLADLFCFDSAYGTETPPFLTPTAEIDARPGSNITCSFTDARGGTLIVDKVTEPIVEFDQNFPFHVTGPQGFDESFSLNTISADYAQTFTSVPDGDFTIAEDLTQLPGWTNTDVTCTNQATGEALHEGRPESDGEVTVHVDPTAVIRCTYTNEAAPAELTLKKTVTNVASTLAWDFNVSLSPGTSSTPGRATLSGTGSGTASHSWSDLLPGQTYVVSEAAESGWNMGDIACSDQYGEVANEGAPGRTFTFTAKVGQELTCEVTNAGLPSTVNLTKITAGIDGTEPWSFPLQISPVPAEETQTKVASGAGLSAVPLSWGNLVPGQTYTITEPNLPAYVTQTLTDCAGATAIPGGLTFVAPLDATVTCTLTNLVAPVDATLTKTSDANGSFTFELANLDTDALPIAIPITASGGEGEAPFNLTAGTRYSLKEIPQPGFTEGPIECTVTPATGQPLDLEDFTVPAGASVACWADNRSTFSTHTLSLQKAWVNAAAGDRAALSIKGATTAPAFAVATAPTTTGGTGTSTQAATDTIASGDQVTVTETLPPTDSAANTGTYNSTLVCSTPAGSVPLTTVAADHRDATFTMPADDVTCMFTNARTTHHLTVTKSWVNGTSGDTATLSINGATGHPGSVTATVPTTNGGTGNSTQAATDDTIASGATVTVTETLPAANTGTYNSTLECVTGNTTITVALTDANRTGTFTLPAGAVDCEFTNTHITHATRIATTLSSPEIEQGGSARDTAEVLGATSDVRGEVQYRYYGSLSACDADAAAFPGTAPAGGTHVRTVTVTGSVVADSGLVTFPRNGTFWWAAFYTGDAKNAAAVSDCRTEPLVAPPATPVIETRVSFSEIVQSGSGYDTAHLLGATSDAGGEVQYRYYGSLTACEADTAAFPGTAPTGGTYAGTVTVTGGVVPDSNTVTFLDPGTYYGAAFYSGDERNAAAVDVCGTERFVVRQAPTPSMTVVKTASVRTFQAAGTPITYYYRVTNTGNVALDQVTVTDTQGLRVSCPHTSLAAGASMTCTAHYVTTAADVRHGSVANVGTATGQTPEGTGVEVRARSALTLPFTRPRPLAPVSPITRVRVQVTG